MMDKQRNRATLLIIILGVISVLLASGFAEENPKTKPFTFVQLCDTQLGFGGYEHDIDSFKQAVKQINALKPKPDFVVICGDLVNKRDDKSFADFKTIKDKLTVPCYCAPGNHDVANKPTPATLKHYRKTLGKDYYSFRHKGYTFVVTNTQLWKAPLKDESEKHEAWVKQTLKEAKEKKSPVFVVAHYPLYAKNPEEKDQYFNLPLKKRKELLTLYKQSGVLAVLAGHTHRTIINTYKGIQLVNGEVTSKNFDKRPLGFRLWTAAFPESVKHEFVPLELKKAGPAYSFVYLGDMHIDKMSHHDLEWVKAKKSNNIRQIEAYVRNTGEYIPGLLKRIQTFIESRNSRIKMIIQGGDLTEGLCGSRELQELQFKDAREIIRKYIPKTTFIAVKGNHEITGPGAREAYDNVMLPWLSEECEKKIDSASFFFMQGPDLFVFFDAYHNRKLDWLEKTLRTNKHRYAIVVMHPPAVPYNARSTWTIFSRDRDKDVRKKFLNILGTYKAVLLTGHLHKYHVLVRKTSTGAFTQFSINSVLSSANVTVKNHLKGVENYGASMVDLEPEFHPDSKQQRQKLLEHEKPFIIRFEFADFPGYAVIHVSDTGISADIYTGDSDKLWKNTALSPVVKE